jgi:F0F1-type ATP synthase assembly protein I
LGLELAVTVAVGGGAGYWLDSWLGSGPWLAVVGAAAGMVLAMYYLIRRANSADRDRDGDV